jgi:hypothetical protein
MTTEVMQFLSNWRTVQHGRLEPGGKLVIEYDPQEKLGRLFYLNNSVTLFTD